MQNKAPQLVLLLGHASLLRDGLTSLLTNEPDFQVEIMTYSELETTLKVADTADSRIFLVCESEPHDRVRTMRILCDILPGETFRVVVIRQDDSMVDVYGKQKVPARTIQDLIAILEPQPVNLPDEGNLSRPV